MANAVPAKAPKQKVDPDIAKMRMDAITTQQAWLRKLELDVDEKEAILKRAKKLAEYALADLRQLCDPYLPAQGELFPGELTVDPATGNVRGYRSIADIEAEIQAQKDAEEREKERKLRKAEANATAGNS